MYEFKYVYSEKMCIDNCKTVKRKNENNSNAKIDIKKAV